MGYLVGKLVYDEREKISEAFLSVSRLMKSSRDVLNLSYHEKDGTIWFKLGKDVLCRVDRGTVLSVLRFHEMDHVEGGGIFICPKSLKEIHDELVYSDGYREGSEEFYFVSLCQYLFCVSPSTIERLHKKGDYVPFKRRSTVKRGRKVGALRYDYDWYKNETKEEILERAEWNMKVGRKKCLYPVFQEGYSEKCRAMNVKFDKKACLDLWNEMDRKERESW